MNPNFENIYEKYKNNVYRLALSYTKNISDSEDIVQNVFIKLNKNLYKLSSEEHIKSWIIRVTINECKTFLLSNWFKKVRFFKENEEVNISIQRCDSDLLNYIQLLSKIDRMVVHLYYYEDYKIKEIAIFLNMKESVIKQRLFRAREKLKEIIKEDYNER